MYKVIKIEQCPVTGTHYRTTVVSEHKQAVHASNKAIRLTGSFSSCLGITYVVQAA